MARVAVRAIRHNWGAEWPVLLRLSSWIRASEVAFSRFSLVVFLAVALACLASSALFQAGE